MRYLWLVLIWVLSSGGIYCQDGFFLSGYVYDKRTGEVLPGASIFDKHSRKGTSCNLYGYYSLYISDPGNAILSYSYVGYKDTIILLGNTPSKNLHVRLQPGLNIKEVVVDATRKTVVNRAESGVIRLPVREVKKLPNLFGEVDIIQAFQQTPGVQSGGEGKSELIVRGGSPDQNLILLDDVPLYYISHFGGFLSVFNVDAISDAQLIKGNAPARYGGRLSSVMDIRMKDGNMQNFSGQGMLGVISSKILLEGPLVKNTSSYMFSARKNTLPIFKVFVGEDLNYNFYDLNGKLNLVVSPKDRVFLSFYTGADAVGFKQRTSATFMKQQSSWGNIMGAIRWNRIYNNRLFSNSTLAFTRYHYVDLFENENQVDTIKRHLQNTVLTGVNDIFLKSDFTYSLLPSYDLRFGIKTIWHTFLPNQQEYKLNETGKQVVDESYKSDLSALDYSMYLENDLDFGRFQINAGLRYSSYSVSGKYYNSFDPRVSFNVLLLEGLSFKYSFSQNIQYIHLLTYSGAGKPANYWMPSTELVKPSNAQQHSLGLAKTFLNGALELSLDTYFKSMKNLIAFKPGTSLAGYMYSWESLVEKGGIGRNYGAEIFLQKSTGRSTGWLGITWARAFRKFKELNNGKQFPYAYDRPLDVNIVWNLEWTEKVIISFAWNYGSGQPITLYSERYMIDNEDVFVFDNINSFRMRDYHRMDFSINFPAKTRWGERNWSISIYNLYNRRNPYYYFYDRKSSFSYINDPDGPGGGTQVEEEDLKLYQRSLFGFFPSFGFSFKF
ncbi:MAG: TonB-dependent receptor [bacterium]